jgi:transcriptional regulator with XRE-family HTH domain
MNKKNMIAARIKAARKAIGLTQKEFGIKMEMNQGAISRVEAGTYQLSPPMLVKVSNLLGESVSHLMCEEDIKKPTVINTEGFATGLEELVQDSRLMAALAIQDKEVKTLSSLKHEKALSKDAYIQMLYVIRQAL